MTCNPVASVQARWRCNVENCYDPDWLGAVIVWPSWAAYNTNARAGIQSRTVYSEQGQTLYPYMGAWANGCQVTAVAGTTLIIEWKRGSNVWRETYLSPGQTHTISLLPHEDGAMIESPATEPFVVSLANCNPQNIEGTPTPSPTPTPVPTGVVQMGETNVLGIRQANVANLLIAQQTTLAQNGTLQSLSFYVSQAGGQLVLGVYDDAGGRPGTLRAQTAPFTPQTGWNTQNVLAPTPLTAGTYWLALLPQSNALAFQGETTGTVWAFGQPFGTMPTTPGTALGTAVAHWSFYATLQTETAAQMVMSGQSRSEAAFGDFLFLPFIKP
jgi:hypothetical protein